VNRDGRHHQADGFAGKRRGLSALRASACRALSCDGCRAHRRRAAVTPVVIRRDAALGTAPPPAGAAGPPCRGMDWPESRKWHRPVSNLMKTLLPSSTHHIPNGEEAIIGQSLWLQKRRHSGLERQEPNAICATLLGNGDGSS
jgi:hypothetical protein